MAQSSNTQHLGKDGVELLHLGLRQRDVHQAVIEEVLEASLVPVGDEAGRYRDRIYTR